MMFTVKEMKKRFKTVVIQKIITVGPLRPLELNVIADLIFF